jgi:predicted O-methyltransferase YrrM
MVTNDCVGKNMRRKKKFRDRHAGWVQHYPDGACLTKNGQLISLEFEVLHARVAKNNIQKAGLDHIVEIRIGKALDLLPQIELNQEGPFDMIFIDADKTPYTEYFQ